MAPIGFRSSAPLRPFSILNRPPFPYDVVGRRALLEQIYKPFAGLEKTSKLYLDLARSGSVWDKYALPFNIEPDRQYQSENKHFLAELDSLSQSQKTSLPHLTKLLIAEVSQQSAAIEGNPLQLGDSEVVYKELETRGLVTDQLTLTDLLDDTLPSSVDLLPKAPEGPTIELRNQLLVANYVASNSVGADPLEGLSESNFLQLHRLLLRDSSSEHSHGWGRLQSAGQFRKLPIQARGHPLTIYPYPLEVPALVRDVFAFRDRQLAARELHSVLLACRILVSSLHIHPFHDGNGRICRMLMADILLRNGFPPPVFRDLDRLDYINAVEEAQKGNVGKLYGWVTETLYDMWISQLQ